MHFVFNPWNPLPTLPSKPTKKTVRVELARPHQPQAPILNVPIEILLEVASYLPTLSDRSHFSCTTYQIYPEVITSIYAAVSLEGVEQCENTLSMLARTPSIARHVQHLSVHPERNAPSSFFRSAGEGSRSDYIDSWNRARIVSKLVAEGAKSMDALQRFEWDAEDALPDDRMWAQLLRCCPNLKSIGTSFGSFLPNPNSHLFSFNDLKGFSLTFKRGFYSHFLHIRSRESDPIYTRLVDMLIHRSPNLESLTIAGFSSQPGDASRLADAHWPSLRSITIGDIIFDPPPFPQPAPVTNLSFLSFLERHTNIESLNLLGHPDVTPTQLAALDAKALPNLSHFTGSLDQLRALGSRGHDDGPPPIANPNPQLPQQQPPIPLAMQIIPPMAPLHPHQIPMSSLSTTLKSICFPEPMQLRDLTPLAISGVLTGMTALTSLTISFSLQSGYDSNGVLRTIVSACPNLLDFDLTCGCKPSFYLESFSRTLKNLSKLRTLSLSVVKVPGDEPMYLGASRIALSNPRLHYFTISFLPPTVPITRGSSMPAPLEKGRYELICDEHGIPTNLLVWERKDRGFGAWASWSSSGFTTGGNDQGGGGGGAIPGVGVGPVGAGVAPAGHNQINLPLGLGIGEINSLISSVFSFFSTVFNWVVTFGFLGMFLVPRVVVGPNGGRSMGRRRMSERRWVCELRPYGHPDVKKKTWSEVFMERSPAGEEARLLGFCLWLVGLAVWGVGKSVGGGGAGVGSSAGSVWAALRKFASQVSD